MDGDADRGMTIPFLLVLFKSRLAFQASLSDVQGPFMVLGALLLISTAVFAAELLSQRWMPVVQKALKFLQKDAFVHRIS